MLGDKSSMGFFFSNICSQTEQFSAVLPISIIAAILNHLSYDCKGDHVTSTIHAFHTKVHLLVIALAVFRHQQKCSGRQNTSGRRSIAKRCHGNKA